MDFSGSRAISDMVEALKQRYGSMLGLWFTFFLIQMAAALVFGITTGVLGMSGSSGSLTAGTMLISFISNSINVYLNSAGTMSMISAASPITKSPFSEAFGIGLRTALWLVLAYLLMGLALLAVGLVLAAIGFGVGAVAGKAAGIALAVVIGLPLLVYVGIKFSMIPPIIAIDDVRSPVEAISRSWRMTQGAALKIFLVQLAFGAVAIVLMLVFFAPVLVTVASETSAGQTPNFAGMVGSVGWAILGFLVLILIGPSASAALVAAIHSQLSGASGGKIGDTFA